MFGPTRTKNAIRTEAEYGSTCNLSRTIVTALRAKGKGAAIVLVAFVCMSV